MRSDLDYQFMDKLKSLPFVDEIWLFGSRARADNSAKSDIDIAVVCTNITENDWLKVTDIVDEADTLLKVDCIKFDKNSISEELYNNILKDRKIIYVKEQD